MWTIKGLNVWTPSTDVYVSPAIECLISCLVITLASGRTWRAGDCHAHVTLHDEYFIMSKHDNDHASPLRGDYYSFSPCLRYFNICLTNTCLSFSLPRHFSLYHNDNDNVNAHAIRTRVYWWKRDYNSSLSDCILSHTHPLLLIHYHLYASLYTLPITTLW